MWGGRVVDRDGEATVEQAVSLSGFVVGVEHRGWTDETYAKVIEHALAGALSQ